MTDDIPRSERLDFVTEMVRRWYSRRNPMSGSDDTAAMNEIVTSAFSK